MKKVSLLILLCLSACATKKPKVDATDAVETTKPDEIVESREIFRLKSTEKSDILDAIKERAGKDDAKPKRLVFESIYDIENLEQAKNESDAKAKASRDELKEILIELHEKGIPVTDSSANCWFDPNVYKSRGKCHGYIDFK